MEFSADDKLKIIRMVREKLVPQIRDQMIAEISELAQRLKEAEEKKRREELLEDPDYCLEKIREFLFPDQPGLWEKVRPLIRSHEWSAIVQAQVDRSLLDAEKLERARGVIREALMIKAEIEEEINYSPKGREPEGAKDRVRAIKNMLAGADEVVDFALKSISEILREAEPAVVSGPS